MLKRVKLVTQRVFIKLYKYQTMMYLRCIFSEDLRWSSSISLFRFDEALWASSKNESCATDLSLREESNWLTTIWIFCSETELLTPKQLNPFRLLRICYQQYRHYINPASTEISKDFWQFLLPRVCLTL